VVLYTNLGHIHSGTNSLLIETGVSINIKYCTKHIIRNLAAKLNTHDKNQILQDCVWRSHGSITFQIYLTNLCNLHDKFTWEAYEYIASIHPVIWTLFGNNVDMYDCHQFQEFTNSFVQDKYKGQPKPIFGFRTNKFVESYNNVDISNENLNSKTLQLYF
jgi:hypothetical protein